MFFNTLSVFLIPVRLFISTKAQFVLFKSDADLMAYGPSQALFAMNPRKVDIDAVYGKTHDL